MSSFLDGTGLGHLIEKIKANFIATSDTTTVTSVGIDSAPTASSTNLVTSGGVYTALGDKQNVIDSSHKLSADLVDDTSTTNKFVTASDKTTWDGKASKVVAVDASTPPNSLDPNKVYQFGTLTGTVTIPAFSSVASGDTEAKIWCFTFSTSTTAPTITWPAAITSWVGGTPTINASKSYEVTVMDGIGAIMEA